MSLEFLIQLAGTTGVFAAGLAFGWTLRGNIKTRWMWPRRPPWAPRQPLD